MRRFAGLGQDPRPFCAVLTFLHSGSGDQRRPINKFDDAPKGNRITVTPLSSMARPKIVPFQHPVSQPLADGLDCLATRTFDVVMLGTYGIRKGENVTQVEKVSAHCFDCPYAGKSETSPSIRVGMPWQVTRFYCI